MKTIAYTSHYSRAAFVSLRAPNCAATIQGQCLFHSELPIVRLLFKGSVCFTQSSQLCGYYIFKGDNYSRVAKKCALHMTHFSQDHTSSVTLGWLEDGDGHLMQKMQSGG